MASAIIVFSHLRWDMLFQRPRHLLSRFARHNQIVLFEEPVYSEGDAFVESWSPAPNVLICRPHTPVNMPGFHDDQLPYLQKLLRQVLRGLQQVQDRIAWFYTPMALPLLQEFEARLVVYDCTDDQAALKNAPKQLQQRENALLKLADIVFAGGPSLYRARHSRHPNVHCVPNSVDAGAFLQSLDRSNSHPAHKDIPGPRLGYYGVIDERVDLELLCKVADAHPMWQIVLVGPLSGIDAASLPCRTNIHYLGEHPVEAIPQFLAGWDVCMLPFVVNESTRCLNPIQTLEYMAAELPIVATPVPDVAEIHGDIVAVAAGARDFVAACEAALLATREEALRRVEAMRERLAATSWDATADHIRGLFESASSRHADRTLLPPDSAGLDEAAEAAPNVNRLRRHEPVRYVKTVIIGAGPTGLSAAFHLGHDALLLDKNPMVGGWGRSIRDRGFTFDYAGHIMLSNDPYVLELYDVLLGSNVHWQEGKAWIHTAAGQAPFPFEGGLPGLPPQGGAAALPRSAAASRPARFGYPRRGGFQALMSAFVPHIKGTIELNAEMTALSPARRLITLADGRRYEYENLISTIPLPLLVRMAREEAPDEVRQAAERLRHMSVRCINLGIGRAGITDKHWIYYPEGAVFHRIFMQGNASPECNPPGSFGIICEVGYHPAVKPLPTDGQDLIERCVRDCIRVGLLREDDRIVAANEADIPYAYVVHDEDKAANVSLLREWLGGHDIVLAGRYGEWADHNSDHAFIAGKKAAEALKWVERKNALVAD
jgi:protoporphyrinogen oxidase/glycosyltransferase involved in cell wall biosynthesis